MFLFIVVIHVKDSVMKLRRVHATSELQARSS